MIPYKQLVAEQNPQQGVPLTNLCGCFSSMPKEMTYRQGAGPVPPSQTAMEPHVNVDIKRVETADGVWLLLSYTCSWCNQEVGNRFLGTKPKGENNEELRR
jgi:hypothetical protein